jgi:hypothetical protein
MNIRIVPAFFAAFLLCGCSYWESATTYVGIGSTEQSEPPQAASQSADAAPTPAPADQAAKSDSWCQQIAKSARDDAAGNGFDSATQRRRAETTYRQCLGSTN